MGLKIPICHSLLASQGDAVPRPDRFHQADQLSHTHHPFCDRWPLKGHSCHLPQELLGSDGGRPTQELMRTPTGQSTVSDWLMRDTKDQLCSAVHGDSSGVMVMFCILTQGQSTHPGEAPT